MPRTTNIWPRFFEFLRELVTAGPPLEHPTAAPAVIINLRDLLQLKPHVRFVELGGANTPTPLSGEDSEIVWNPTVYAGPLADGSTANTSPLWLGGRELQRDGAAPGTVTKGLPLAPGGERSFEGQVDLAELVVMSATSTDVARVLYWSVV